MDQTPKHTNGFRLMVQAPALATIVQPKTPLNPDEETKVILTAIADRSQFARLYDIYYDRIYYYLLRRCAEPCLAEDLTAETFLKAMRHLHNFQFREIPFAAWLYRIAHNQFISHCRREKIRRLFRIRARQENRNHADFSRIIDQTDQTRMTEKLAELLQQIRPVDQLLITLRYFEDFSLEDSAHAAGLKPGAARTRLHRALRQLKILIESQAPELASCLVRGGS